MVSSYVISLMPGVVDAKGMPGIKSEKGPRKESVSRPTRGFMVAYKESIPGTDVSFEMVPIPAGSFLMGSPESEADRARGRRTSSAC